MPKSTKESGLYLLLGSWFALLVAPGVAYGQSEAFAGIDEIVIVTAAKREQDIRKVAGSVSAKTGAQLKEIGAQSLSDYIQTLPGVTFNDYQPGISEVIVRGVSSTTFHEQGQTVVGYYINEIPLSEAGFPIIIPDVDTFDLNRVEVLRGPQGTLFGSASLGGLVNYIVNEADTSLLDAAFEGGWSKTKNAGESNYAAKGMVNIPIVQDKLAVRGVLFERSSAGFIDNVGTGDEGANDFTTQGGRISVVFTPNEGTKVSLLSMYQETELDDQTYLTVPTLTRNTLLPEPQDTRLWVHSVRLDQDVGFADFTLLGSIAEKDNRTVFDQTITGFLQGTETRTIGNATADSKTVEARLTSKPGKRFDWIVGGMYYKSEKESADDVVQAGAGAFIDANPADFGGFPGSLLAANDVISSFQIDQTNEEFAFFGELSFHLTDALTITAGGRYFDTSSDSSVIRPPSATFIGVFDENGSFFNEKQSETGFTPKVSIAYNPSDRFYAYALYSKGFRVGGANPNPPAITGAAASYDSDSVNNYEIGFRSSWLDNDLLLDITLFHIDWTDIQVRLFGPAPLFLAFVTNAGAAKIDGVEFSGQWAITPNFDLASNVTYVDARLSEFLPDTFAAGGGHASGTTVPGSSEWTVSNTATFHFDGRWEPSFSISQFYISEAPVAFSSPTTKGGYNLIDLRASVTLADNIDLQVYANNVFDKYAVINAPFADFFPQPLASVTRPRTVGVSINWSLN